jgi:hypothetical protein
MRGVTRRACLSIVSVMVAVATATANFTVASAAIHAPGNVQGPASAPRGAHHGIQVLYRGKTVSYAQLNRTLEATYCDDHLGPGKLTCYSSQRALERATLVEGGYTPSEARQVARLIGIAVPRQPWHSARTASSSGCSPAVIGDLFSKPNGQGSEISLYCNYPNFATIGWSKRARSGESPNCDILGIVGFTECTNLWDEINYIDLQITLVQHISDIAAISQSGDQS